MLALVIASEDHQPIALKNGWLRVWHPQHSCWIFKNQATGVLQWTEPRTSKASARASKVSARAAEVLAKGSAGTSGVAGGTRWAFKSQSHIKAKNWE
jgi:hypothetical protein